jgi:hypothetical protein
VIVLVNDNRVAVMVCFVQPAAPGSETALVRSRQKIWKNKLDFCSGSGVLSVPFFRVCQGGAASILKS